MHVVKYESLANDYETQIFNLSEFLEFPLSQKLFDSRANSNFRFLIKKLLSKISVKNVASSVRFNKGKMGEWKNYFDKDDLAYYDQISLMNHI